MIACAPVLVGIVWVARALNAGPVAFGLLCLLVNVNGHVVARLAVGHLRPWLLFRVERLERAFPLQAAAASRRSGNRTDLEQRSRNSVGRTRS
jgi:hypothetical protein